MAKDDKASIVGQLMRRMKTELDTTLVTVKESKYISLRLDLLHCVLVKNINKLQQVVVFSAELH